MWIAEHMAVGIRFYDIMTISLVFFFFLAISVVIQLNGIKCTMTIARWGSGKLPMNVLLINSWILPLEKCVRAT
jgi:hypothetical protein